MPFDGVGFAPNAIVAALDRMAELLGKDGERWCKCMLRSRANDGTVSHCLIGALREVTQDEGVRETVLAALSPAEGVNQYERESFISHRNDRTKTRWSDMRAWLAEARQRAEALPCP